MCVPSLNELSLKVVFLLSEGGETKNGNCHQLSSCADLIETKNSAVNARANGPEGFAND